MSRKLTGNPYKYIEKIQEASSGKKRLSREGNRTERFWNMDCPPDAFDSHPDSLKAILYDPYNV